ncbi:hypothetical protein [Methylobacter sp. BlB1]|uniref:hypothetical protein n=1 Tax=Methylobacter sp. BlB1 TaxID=2785914 RepID=UPI001895C3B0|nr:hypothetical protein [Methylobacter sp. BlB1]MBF6650213.1 hypothetical protein [Methylobacter sp. BlB1]
MMPGSATTIKVQRRCPAFKIGKTIVFWIVHNTQDAKTSQIDRYLITVANIETQVGAHLLVTGEARTQKPKASWLVPIACNKG